MSIPAFVQAIHDSSLSMMVRGDGAGTEWLFPIIETLHVFSLAIVFGSILMVDLRLLGLTARSSAVSKLSAEVLPWTWWAFAASVITGSVLATGKIDTYWVNGQFRMKYLCMALAGLNMLVFHFGVYRRVAQWDTALPTPVAARAAGVLSIALWTGVIFFGRWIGFVT